MNTSTSKFFKFYPLLSLASLALLTGCETMPQDPTIHYLPANPIIEKPAYIAPKSNQNARLVTGSDPVLTRAFAQYIKTGKAPNIITDGFLILAYNPSTQPIIQTIPFQETVVSLETGEKFSNISSGDPSRWSYAVAMSGTGMDTQQHVLIKPSAPNLATNLIITTNRRMYNLRLVSKSGGNPTRDVNFWYPEELLEKSNQEATRAVESQTVDTTSSVSVEHLNFHYQISSLGGGFFESPPAWQPVQIFDDGKQTFIQFPENIKSQDLPALYILDNGQSALVNYRMKAPYFVVDRVFHKAELLLGSPSATQKVELTNLTYR